MTDELPRHAAAGQVIDANLHLLDRQVLDNDGKPVSYISDIELETNDSDDLVISNLVVGTGVLARFFGGNPPSKQLFRIPWKDVSRVGITIRLGVGADGLDVTWAERWVRDRIIGRIPGGDHAAE